MTLAKYKAKRDLKKSKEPAAKKSKTPTKKAIFVVHDHHASHHHYDLRFERRGVLKSWAIPKLPPRSKGTKRLAIKVEDHPLAYATFEGTIPKGHYGAGTVKIWDKGTYEVKSVDAKKIEVIFHGNKLKGNYVLIKTHYGSKPEKSWLFFKI